MGKNYTLYIRNDNDERFSREEDPGPLVNKLLAQHYMAVEGKVQNFAAAGIASTTNSSMAMTGAGAALKTTVTPNAGDVAKFKARIEQLCPNGHMLVDGVHCMTKKCKYAK